jgi:hypothetical protein
MIMALLVLVRIIIRRLATASQRIHEEQSPEDDKHCPGNE